MKTPSAAFASSFVVMVRTFNTCILLFVIVFPVFAYRPAVLPVQLRHPAEVTMFQKPVVAAFQELSSIMLLFCDIVN